MNTPDGHLSGAHPDAPLIRDFSAAELVLRHNGQQRLIQQRLSAKVLGESMRQPYARTQQPTLKPTVSNTAQKLHFMTPPQPLASQTVSDALDSAIERVKQGQLTLAARWTTEALERVQPILDGQVRRRDARHNAQVVLRALMHGAYTLIDARKQLHQYTTTYTYFTVLEMLPVVTGLSSDQCERATRRLQQLGLIHKSTGAIPVPAPGDGKDQGKRAYVGGTWVSTTVMQPETGEQFETMARAGTWVAVLLRPLPGRTARVIAHELPVCPRDLTADRRQGRTAWQALQKLKSEVRESFFQTGEMIIDVAPLLVWSLPEVEKRKGLDIKDSRTSLFGDVLSPQDLAWSLSRIVSTHPQRRREAVQEGAVRLVSLLRDPGSEKHYYRILWRATEAEFDGFPAYAQLACALERTLIAVRELNLQRPGAWLTRLLRDVGWLDAVYRRSPLARTATSGRPISGKRSLEGKWGSLTRIAGPKDNDNV